MSSSEQHMIKYNKLLIHTDRNKICFIAILGPIVPRKITKLLYINNSYMGDLDNRQISLLIETIRRESLNIFTQERLSS